MTEQILLFLIAQLTHLVEIHQEHPVAFDICAAIAFLVWLHFSTWQDYLALMSIRRAKKQTLNATPTVRISAYYILAKGLPKDFLYNVIHGTLIFRTTIRIPLINISIDVPELPREWLFTHRCERHLTAPEGSINLHRAKWACHNWLDPYDLNGRHCGDYKT